MNVVFDKFGHRGIAFWWMLVELCSENWDGVSEPKFSFHPRLVSTKLKTRSNLVQPYLELCSNLGMGKFEVSPTKIDIDMPNLRKIKESRGRIKGNRSEKPDIYRKEEDKEEDLDLTPTPLASSSSFDPRKFLLAKKICPDTPAQEAPRNITPDEVVDAWNTTMGASFGYCPGLGGGTHRDNCLEAIKYLPNLESWNALFEKAKASKFLTGQNESGWTVNCLWIVNYDNALKVLSDVYDDGKAIKNLFAGMAGESA